MAGVILKRKRYRLNLDAIFGGDKMEIYCPFCDKLGVEAVKTPGYLNTHRSRGSGQSGAVSFMVAGGLHIMSGCSECGKTRKDVAREFQ